MTHLASIPGIGKANLELLEAAGFPDAESLSVAGIEELTAELERAQRILKISKRAPAQETVGRWITAARNLTGVPKDLEEPEGKPTNHELSPQVAEMLAGAPFAIPLPGRLLLEQKLGVEDVPPAILLSQYSGDLEVRVEDRVPTLKVQRPPAVVGNVRLSEPNGSRFERIDPSKLRSTTDVANGVTNGIAAKIVGENERVALIRGPLEETNKGRNPQSRTYIRGVLHGHPVMMALGALFTVAVVVIFPLGLISTALLMLSDMKPEHFGWVSKWVLVFPLSLPVFGLGYLIWGLSGSCRICGQKLFVPRMCLKNTKAHHFPLLGHIVPLCVHLLLFRWFRCTYCGTPVRLKK